MKNATQRTTSKDNDAIRREMAELLEHPDYVHHVADAATGKVLTTQLDHPVSPVSRAQRLSQLGDQFDFSIFGFWTHRLTPQRPYQASPNGALRFFGAREVSTYGEIQSEGHVQWGPGSRGQHGRRGGRPSGGAALPFNSILRRPKVARTDRDYSHSGGGLSRRRTEGTRVVSAERAP